MGGRPGCGAGAARPGGRRRTPVCRPGRPAGHCGGGHRPSGVALRRPAPARPGRAHPAGRGWRRRGRPGRARRRGCRAAVAPARRPARVACRCWCAEHLGRRGRSGHGHAERSATPSWGAGRPEAGDARPTGRTRRPGHVRTARTSHAARAVDRRLAAAGTEVLLVDADVYGGVIAAVLGLLDEAPGLAAAARMANTGTLDLPALAGLAREVSPRLRVLTGLPRAHRWPELRPAAVETVLDVARRLVPLIVVDCGFCLEQDEELAYDTTAPRRNGATLTVLQAADTVLAVGGADPISLHRLLRGLSDLREIVPDVVPLVVVNRLRRRVVVAGDAQREIRAALERYAGVPDVAFLPQDQSALDAAVATGRTLAEAAPDSPLRAALIELAGMVSGRPQSSPSPSRGWRRRLRT